jgi:hypothetical protein
MLVAKACNPSFSGGRDQEYLRSQPKWVIHELLSQKYPTHTKNRVDKMAKMAKVLEHLLLSPDPLRSTTNTKNKLEIKPK